MRARCAVTTSYEFSYKTTSTPTSPTTKVCSKQYKSTTNCNRYYAAVPVGRSKRLARLFVRPSVCLSLTRSLMVNKRAKNMQNWCQHFPVKDAPFCWLRRPIIEVTGRLKRRENYAHFAQTRLPNLSLSTLTTPAELKVDFQLKFTASKCCTHVARRTAV